MTGRVAAALVVLCAPVLLVAGGQEERKFVPDHPGKVSVVVNRHTNPKATAQEVAAFNANLTRLRDLLVAGPLFNPPRGVQISGWLNIDHNPPADVRAPILGTGLIQFYPYVLSAKTGLPYRFIVTTAEVNVWVNKPDANLVPNFSEGAARFYIEPERAGTIGGFPVYRRYGGDDILILSSGTKPFWVPVTREELVTAWLRHWEKEAAGSPAADTITPKVAANHRAALAAMSADQRRMPARYLAHDPMEPVLAPVGSTAGQALVKLNPEWYDAALPRSAFQLVSLRFQYGGDLDDKRPESTSNVDVLRVWQMLHQSDWPAIGAAALTRK